MTEAVEIHASTVAIGGRGVVLLGASGAGKSDLALRLIDRGAELVADDCTRLIREEGRLVARCPDTIVGQMEVRGVGIVRRPARAVAPVALAVTLGKEAERLPEAATVALAGVEVPAVTLDPRPPSAAIKVELALAAVPELAA